MLGQHTNTQSNHKLDPKIPKFDGREDGLQIKPFLNIFEQVFNTLSDNEKIIKIIAFLDGDAANYFGTGIFSEIDFDWISINSKLIDRYAHTESAINCCRHSKAKKY